MARRLFLALFLLFQLVLRDASPHELFHQSGRKRFVHRKADGPFGGREALQQICEFSWQGSREETAMVRERGVTHEPSFVLEAWDAVADGFAGLSGHDRADQGASFLQGAAGGFRHAREVFVHAVCDRSFRGSNRA